MTDSRAILFGLLLSIPSCTYQCTKPTECPPSKRVEVFVWHVKNTSELDLFCTAYPAYDNAQPRLNFMVEAGKVKDVIVPLSDYRLMIEDFDRESPAKLERLVLPSIGDTIKMIW